MIPTWLWSPKLWGAIALVVVVGVVYYAGGIGPRGEITLLEQKEDARLEKEKRQAVVDFKNKERTDEENARTRAALDRQLAGLRESIGNTPLGFGDDPVHPDLITFDRAEFTRSLQSYRLGVAGLVAEGAACVADLDSLKAWDKSRGN